MPRTEVERRLAAIMFSDIVGYTALMGRDEEAARSARDRHEAVLRPLVERYGGEWVERTGDETLSAFPSALDAVNCALAAQAELESDLDLRLRVGIHHGDVTFDAAGVSGDGVNVAARVRPMARPGGICVTGDVHHSVRGRPGLVFEPLGEQKFKNVDHPVAVFAVSGSPSPPQSRGGSQVPRRRPTSALTVAAALLLAAGGVALWRVYDPAELPPTTRTEQPLPGFRGAPAIAVLPFDNLSGDPEDEYFADGISEDLITRLSSSPHYPVIARNSTFVYKGRALDVKELGRELGARYIIEGSVRRSDDVVRITAQLIDATTATHLWAESYDRKVEGIFALQDEIVEQIRKSINPSLFQAEQARALRKDPRNLDAWELVQRGWSHARRFTKADNERARAYFEQAIELDPLWADPLASLAWTHNFDISHQWTDSPGDSLAELRSWAQRAIEADRQSAVAQLMLGTAHMYSGERRLAIEAFESAVRLNPSSVDARQYLGGALTYAGRSQEAIPVLEDALRLSSRHDMSDLLSALAFAHFASGQYEAAVERGRQAIPWAREKAPALAAINYSVLAVIYSELGRDDEAQAAMLEILRLRPDFSLGNAQLSLAAMNPDLAGRFIAGLRRAGLKE